MSLFLDLWARVVGVWGQHRLVITIVLGMLAVVALSNLAHLRRLGDLRPSGSRTPVAEGQQEPWPLVSVLIPARNEEANIGRCLESLMVQDYPDYEILVLDDESTDSTAEIVREIQARCSRVRLLRGRTLPPGWLGKHWACHQLAQEARGDLLLFTDADTWHRPSMLRSAVISQRVEQADLISAFPKEHVITWSERLVLPVMAWALFALLPLAFAHRSRSSLLSGAIGQFMLFTRHAYESIGGHAAVRSDVVDDMALARLVKANGLKWRLLDGTCQVECRMYRNVRGVVDGFGKCIFPALRYRLSVLAIVYLVLGFAFLEPIGTLAWQLLVGPVSGAGGGWAWIAVGLGLVPWLVAYVRLDLPSYLALLFPLTVVAVMLIGVRSVLLFNRGRATWKERVLAQNTPDG